MLIDSLEVIIYTFQFIIPGYIIREVISSILPQKNYSEGEKAIQSIGYSVLNIAIWYWLFLIIQDKLQNDSIRREAITKKQERMFLKFIKDDSHFSKYYLKLE